MNGDTLRQQMPTMRDLGFDDGQRRAAAKVAAQLASDGVVVHAAYLSGSLAVGLGHSLSDVDLYVVANDDVAKGLERVVDHGADGQVQINPVPLTEFEGLLELGAEFRATGRDRGQVLIPEEMLLSLIRFTIGERITVAARVADGVEAFRRETVRKIVMARYARRAAALTEDALGAAASGDVATAVTATNLLCVNAAECLLGALDDIYLGPKFLHRRLARAAADGPVPALVWRACFEAPSPSAGPDELHEHVRDQLKLGQRPGCACASGRVGLTAGVAGGPSCGPRRAAAGAVAPDDGDALRRRGRPDGA